MAWGLLVYRDMSDDDWAAMDKWQGWLLCEYPERAPDGYTHVHLVRCQACRIGAEVAARQWPERWKLIYDLQTLYWAENVESPPLSPSSGL